MYACFGARDRRLGCGYRHMGAPEICPAYNSTADPDLADAELSLTKSLSLILCFSRRLPLLLLTYYVSLTNIA